MFLAKCLQESVFMFNNKLYKQIDVVSMGNKLGPITTDICMDKFDGSVNWVIHKGKTVFFSCHI